MSDLGVRNVTVPLKRLPRAANAGAQEGFRWVQVAPCKLLSAIQVTRHNCSDSSPEDRRTDRHLGGNQRAGREILTATVAVCEVLA